MPPPIFTQFIDPCNDPNFNKPPPLTGVSQTAGDDGVFGVNCAGGTGVRGHSATGVGLRGDSNSGNGVQGRSGSGVAVCGDSDSFLGVFGRSNTNDGIQGRSAAHDHAGVSAINESNGFGLFASSDGGGLAGVFNGGVKVDGNVEVTGDINCHEASKITCFDVSLIGGDCAEEFNIVNKESVEQGTVMVIDNEDALLPSNQAYDKKVAGVISGAGNYNPGIVLDKRQTQEKRMPIALVGKVYCKVDA
jgi:hypothetical protein